MLVKIHKSYRDVVAVCDSELIGKRLEEGIMQLEINENFFKGEEKAEKEAVNIIRNAAGEDATFNIVGRQAVDAALKAGIISREGIKTIQGVPFALVFV
ncbi:DUF424 family protein [Candidatus Pacearchaeota archaeon]|nr:DUF424 family protein [Candidatus Pacearchaeota archaeon]